MKQLNISKKSQIIIVVLGILSVVAIRFNTKPEIYTGFIFALVGILLIGFYASNKLFGGIFGALTVGLGLLLRNFWPQVSTLKGDKLVAFTEQFNAYKEFIGSYFWLMILAGFLIGLLGGAVGEIIDSDKNKHFSTYRITYIAIFTAISVAINSVRIGSVSFGGFPIILAGYFLGPINGLITGAVADIVGFLIRPSASGAFNPLFSLTSALTGLIPVIITNLLGEKYPKYTIFKVLCGVFVGQMLTSVILAPLFTSILYAKNTFWYYAAKALIKQAISIPIYAFLVVAMADKLGVVIKTSQVAGRA